SFSPSLTLFLTFSATSPASPHNPNAGYKILYLLGYRFIVATNS
ncbi:uncharacterized protein METZ01_LOCUS366359, partial [marine metagenome]